MFERKTLDSKSGVGVRRQKLFTVQGASATRAAIRMKGIRAEWVLQKYNKRKTPVRLPSLSGRRRTSSNCA